MMSCSFAFEQYSQILSFLLILLSKYYVFKNILNRELESLLAKSPEKAVDGASPEESTYFTKMIAHNPEFFHQAFKLAFCFCGLQTSYLTWGIMQELIMTTSFEPTEGAPDGRFPSAAFCVFSNRFLAVIVAIIAVRIKHGAIFSNNTAPLQAFTPAAISNTISSWSNYAALRYVSFPVQTIFKSSKMIAVMMMGKFLKGTQYPYTQYVEAFIITFGEQPESIETFAYVRLYSAHVPCHFSIFLPLFPQVSHSFPWP